MVECNEKFLEILPQPGDYQESEAVEKMCLELEKLSAELMSQEAKQSLKESLNTLTTRWFFRNLNIANTKKC